VEPPAAGRHDRATVEVEPDGRFDGDCDDRDDRGDRETAAPVRATSPTSIPAVESVGCAAPLVSPGTTTQILRAGDESGGYVREIPKSYTGRTPMPVVIDPHGYQETAYLQAQLGQLGTLGAAARLHHHHAPTAGSVSEWQTGYHSKDVAFIGGLIQAVDASLCVDLNRVYVTGYSNGAFLASVVACVYPGQVVAVATVAGLVNPVGCDPSRPVPVIAFHGTSDPAVGYKGGLGPGAPKFTGPGEKPLTVAQALGPNTPKPHGPSTPPSRPPGRSATAARRPRSSHRVAAGVTLLRFKCPTDDDVELCRVSGGGHTWPREPHLRRAVVHPRLHRHGHLGEHAHVELLCGAPARFAESPRRLRPPAQHPEQEPPHPSRWLGPLGRACLGLLVPRERPAHAPVAGASPRHGGVLGDRRELLR
jgi:polyhydroxybutyrate depolymerase